MDRKNEIVDLGLYKWCKDKGIDYDTVVKSIICLKLQDQEISLEQIFEELTVKHKNCGA